MVPFFPKTVANKGMLFYFLSVITVSILFMDYAMGVPFLLMGAVWVVLFFYGSNLLTVHWENLSQKQFLSRLFWTAFVIRLLWVVFSYFFYINKTGQPFEFAAADSLGYHEESEWLAKESWSKVFDYLFWSRSGYSDSGYSLYLTVVYKAFGANVIIPRVLKACCSAFTCVLLYKLAFRSMGDKVARMTGVFAMLMPNLIVYCGLHVKETEMLFLMVAFLERTDFVLRSRKLNMVHVILPIVLAASLFLFRTVLGAVALFSFVTALLFSPSRVVEKGRKVMLLFWMVLAVAVLAGGVVMNEVEELWQNRESNQEQKRIEQTSRGNQWAKYATGTVMAPMMFVLPFPTMVDVDEQYNQQILSGGNYVRNFLGGFVLLAVFSAFFVKKDWRNLSLIGSFVIAYLGIVSASGFANSERFLLPGLPALLIIAAYGVSLLNAKNYRFIKAWYWVVPLMVIGWAVFKLGSRGLL